jgi:hypothetical protein
MKTYAISKKKTGKKFKWVFELEDEVFCPRKWR